MFKKDSSFSVMYTDNVTNTHQFYKTIGAEIMNLETDRVIVGLGDFEIHFVLTTSENVPEYHKVAKEKNRGGSSIMYIEVEDIEKMYKKVTHASGKILAEIAERPWELKEFLFEDPNGYKIVCYEEI